MNTIEECQNIIDHYKRSLRNYRNLLDNTKDRDLIRSLESSIDACLLSIERAQSKYDSILFSESFQH